jgi:hypothetical protein
MLIALAFINETNKKGNSTLGAGFIEQRSL